MDMEMYMAKNSKDFPGFLIVNCPRLDCPSFGRRPFVVHRDTWLRPLRRVAKTGSKQAYTIVGRSCPYCFRVSSVPRRKDIRK